MGYIQTLTSVVIVAVTLFVSDANASVSFDGYIKAQQNLIDAQRNSPNHIIRLTDQQDNLAFAVLNYDKFESVLIEIKGDIKKGDKLRELLILTELIFRSYSPTFIDANSPSFAKKGNQYIFETEYLSTEKILLRIFTEMSKNSEYISIADTLQQTLKQFLSILSGQIQEKIFSKNGVAEANIILSIFDKTK